MKNKKFVRFSFLIEMIVTFFVPAKILSNPAIITYEYGFPIRYLNVYSKINTDHELINILFKGNNGINFDLITFMFNIIFIYLLISFIFFIIKKIQIKSKKNNP